MSAPIAEPISDVRLDSPELLLGQVAPPWQNAATIEKQVRRVSRRRLFTFNTLGWSVTDAVIAVLAIGFGFLASPVASGAATSETAVKLIPCALTFAMLLVPTAHVAGLHDPRRRSGYTDLIVRCLLVTIVAISALSLGWILLSFLRIGRYVLVLSSVMAIVAMVATRVLSWRWSTKFQPKICFVGTDSFVDHVQSLVTKESLPMDVTRRPRSVAGLGQWAVTNDVDEVVYDDVKPADAAGLLGCLDAGVRVSSYCDFVEHRYQRIPVNSIDTDWLFSARLDLAHPYYQGVKRAIDSSVALVGLLVSTPLIIIAAIAIRLESPGSVFYSQVRTGRFNRPFRIWKLRTMCQNSEVNGAQWAAKNDSRITAVGKILRKTRLDELPQFWNVLRGEMSLIGPRPERPEFVKTLAEEIPFFMQRHLVKPGLTGWAQINYPYGASTEDAYNKLTYDLYYIKNASLALDLQIFLRTIGTVMKGSR
jgi:exopolysaccharide biosynthesis polyprenyl glycosylphosphotransferase